MRAWERRDDESPRAFEAFAAYRDMGPGRSIAAVAAKLRKSIALCNRWSQRHDWVERAASYDGELDARKADRAMDAIAEMEARHAKIASVALGKVVARLAGLDAAELSPTDIARLLDIGVKVERLSRGTPTERVDSNVTVEPEPDHLDDLDPSAKAAILRAMADDLEAQAEPAGE